LQKNEFARESELFIFSDGPRNEKEVENVKRVRQFVKTIKDFKKITIIERDGNYGLANNIINGITRIVNQYGKIIVLEDDMITSPYFLKFMNEALEMYENEERVASIHGYAYPVKEKLPPTYFIRGADCWGWATWKRAWDLFEPDGKKLLEGIKKHKLQKLFDFNNSYPYTSMLEGQVRGRNNSWAIRWYASIFLKNMLTLYPFPSVVKNIGLDASGIHCGLNPGLIPELSNKPIAPEKISMEENQYARRAFEKFFRSNRFMLGKIEKVLKIFKNKLKDFIKPR